MTIRMAAGPGPLEALEGRLFLAGTDILTPAEFLLHRLGLDKVVATVVMNPQDAAQPLAEVGSARVWGNDLYGQVTNTPAYNDFSAVAAGAYFAVGLRSDGSLAAWGNNSDGQCNVPAGNDFKAIAAGSRHALALKADGSLAAWGNNDNGQLAVPAGNDFLAISACSDWSVAVRQNGSLVAWGAGDFGDTSVVDAANAVNGTFKAVSAGHTWGMALRTDGSIARWGTGPLGGSLGTLPKDTGLKAISAGLNFGLALKADGSILAWGANAEGETSVPAGNDFTAIAARALHCVALRSDGTIAVWGDDSEKTATNVPSGSTYVAVAAGEVDSLALAASALPTVQIDQSELLYVVGVGRVSALGSVTIGRAGGDLAGATIKITDNYQADQDVLAGLTGSGILASFNPATGTLSLSGSASVAAYQRALARVTYQNTADPADTSPRTLSVTITDGASTSATVSRTIRLEPLNHVPEVQGQSVTVAQDDSAVLNLLAADTETAFDLLAFHIPQRTPHGSLSVLGQGQVEYTPDPGYTGLDAFAFSVTDDGSPGDAANAATSPAATVIIRVGT